MSSEPEDFPVPIDEEVARRAIEVALGGAALQVRGNHDRSFQDCADFYDANPDPDAVGQILMGAACLVALKRGLG